MTHAGTTISSRDESRATSPALATVDSALQYAGARRVFTRDEAITVMTRLEASLSAVDAAAVAPILHDALASFEGDLLIDHERVVNPLLDARLALARTN